jgi:hypothetical protein
VQTYLPLPEVKRSTPPPTAAAEPGR